MDRVRETAGSGRSLATRLGAERGGALVELAIASPLLLIMVLGAFDFGRVFYYAMAVTAAARAGAQYGAQDNGTTGHNAGMTSAAQTAAPNILPITVTPSRFCRCANGNTANCFSLTACAEGAPRIFVQVIVTKTFNTVTFFPGIPQTVNLSRTAILRAQ